MTVQPMIGVEAKAPESSARAAATGSDRLASAVAAALDRETDVTEIDDSLRERLDTMGYLP